MRSHFITLCLLLPGVISSAQQTGKTREVSPEVHEMQQIEDRWDEAIAQRDQYALELVLAPQFIGISASGDVVNRNQQIAHLFVKNEGPQSLEQKVVSVRLVGQVAIVNGTYVMTWKGEKGPILEKGIFSHVFEHLRNNWLCLNSQRTVVAEETKGAVTAKPKTKRSDAELPMHVPLVYKGPDSTQQPPRSKRQPAPAIDEPHPDKRYQWCFWALSPRQQPGAPHLARFREMWDTTVFAR